MNPPTKNLFGGVEELHTREYLPKILAQMMGRRERSKFWTESSKNARTKCRTRVLGERRGRRKKTYLASCPMGPRCPVGAARVQATPAGRLGHWWPPWSAPGAPGSPPHGN